MSAFLTQISSGITVSAGHGPTAAAREANVKELMAHMGHARARAALVYQHVDPEREREIAQALSTKVAAERPDHLAREWRDGDDEAGESS